MLEQIASWLHAAMLPIATITGLLMLIAGMVFTAVCCVDYAAKRTGLLVAFAQFMIDRERRKQKAAPAPRLRRRKGADA